MENDKLHMEIKNLTSKSCPDVIWDTIELRLEEEILKDKIDGLSESKTPEAVWLSLASELTLKQELSKLERKAPAEVWEGIQMTLPPTRRVVKLGPWISAAAILTIVFSIWWLQAPKDVITISEVEMPIHTEMKWNEEDRQWEVLLKEACDQQPFACQSERFKTLEEELSFLSQSKQEVLNQLNPYEENPQVNKILTEIELERIEVIKAMIQETLS